VLREAFFIAAALTETVLALVVVAMAPRLPEAPKADCVAAAAPELAAPEAPAAVGRAPVLAAAAPDAPAARVMRCAPVPKGAPEGWAGWAVDLAATL